MSLRKIDLGFRFKNSSLGEIYSKLASKGIAVPDGFATTADAFREYLRNNALEKPLQELMHSLDIKEVNFKHRRTRSALQQRHLPHACAYHLSLIK